MSIRRKGDVASIVMGRRNSRDDLLRFTGCLEIASLVAEPDHAIAVGNVNPPRVGSQGIKRNTEWLFQSARKYLVADSMCAAGWDPQYMHRIEHRIGDE